MVERIKQVIKYADMSERAFAERIGVKQNTLNQQIKGERSISLDIISKILISFENISAEWLLRGEGEMIKGDKEAKEKFASNEFVVYVDENGFLKVK
ncbi:helix-turn-helix transcriptional regulator [Bacteroides uniformis]|uniref:helix-turn-helix domain-containing protein n=1 Tax=Bacteroides uniformis TaxID=820 RepID=UPI00233E8CED|nr:helix-turn-helix transcriptional regulator [Bacteroides uniformis]MDC1810345.1 helix-turn-helix transcriptional regulator [Bacteroides uniformis]